jgi:serine/threonine protein kinase/tetratricopeptide (TPR) repeat protein
MRGIPPVRVRFGDFELNLRTGELHRGEGTIELQQQPFQVLLMLVERGGEIATREEIQKKLWPNDTVVEFDQSINAVIKKLRKALGDSADDPKYIKTLARLGYRLMVPVECVAAVPAKEVSSGVYETALPPRRAASSLTGNTISHYRVLEIVGAGGMGVVYRAEDLKLGRAVALKFLPEELGDDPRALERFEREARAASALDHPNICSIYEFGEHEGQPFIVMQLLEGETLRDRLASTASQVSAERAFSVDQLVDVAVQIAMGLEAAHEGGIIHRDIKPANIFLTNRGLVKILDFGVAELMETGEYPNVAPDQQHSALPLSTFDGAVDALNATHSGMAIGTTGYMSPEQAHGDRLDARTDLFSFGLVLYEMATGQRAFGGGTAAVVRDAVLNNTPVPLRELNSMLPARLVATIGKALEKDRERRYQSAAQMRTDLLATPGRGTARKSQRRSWSRRSKLTAATVIFVFVVMAVCGGLWGGRARKSSKALKLTGKDTIVLADFANSTGDAIFDDTLKSALSISLRQSPFLNVLPDSTVAKTLQLMMRPAGTKLTPEVALELCQRAGSKAYIAGTIGSLGSEYVLRLKAVNCQSGDTLAEEQVTAASKEKVLDALGESASKLRSELGESLASVRKFDVPLAQATTSSLEALKEYSVLSDPSRVHTLRAIELDPNFAMAYLSMGVGYASAGDDARASEYLTKAFQLREHASEWEKLFIAMSYYRGVTGELDKASDAGQQMNESYPGQTLNGDLGQVYMDQGEYEKAAEVTRQSLRLDPEGVSNLGIYSNLAEDALGSQHLGETRQIIQEAEGRKAANSILHLCHYALAFLQADATVMSEQQQLFVGKSTEFMMLELASDTEAYGGHLRRQRELTRRAVDAAIRADSKEDAGIFLAIAAQREAVFGNPSEARRTAAEASKFAPTSLGVESESALASALAGDAVRAGSLAQDLDKRFPLHTQMQSIWLPAIRAQLALGRKDPVLALKSVHVPSPIELGEIEFVPNLSCLYSVYARGEAYLAAGQGNAAAAEFQRIIDHSGIVWNCWTGALARLGIARANALQSRTLRGADADAARVRALATYKDFLTLWKEADPDIPILKQAKTEYAKLTAHMR